MSRRERNQDPAPDDDVAPDEAPPDEAPPPDDETPPDDAPEPDAPEPAAVTDTSPDEGSIAVYRNGDDGQPEIVDWIAPGTGRVLADGEYVL